MNVVMSCVSHAGLPNLNSTPFVLCICISALQEYIGRTDLSVGALLALFQVHSCLTNWDGYVVSQKRVDNAPHHLDCSTAIMRTALWMWSRCKVVFSKNMGFTWPSGVLSSVCTTQGPPSTKFRRIRQCHIIIGESLIIWLHHMYQVHKISWHQYKIQFVLFIVTMELPE